ncbi:MAG: FHA domain-containing protein [Woeseiaceae bacterium]
MDLGAAGLSAQPFPTHGKPLATLSYRSERAALEILNDTYVKPKGLCLIQGPALSGKSTLISSFIATLHEDCAVALVDGKGLNTTNLLVAVLREFGFNLQTSSANELLGLVRVFALQQATSHEPPLLVIENSDEMKPSALRALCELADLRVRMGSAFKIVLVSDRSLGTIMRAPAMESISRRILHDFHLYPMTQREVKDYLYSKLQAAGSDNPAFIFPEGVCTELWNASGGWPGILDRLALLSLANAATLPVKLADIEHPALPSGTWDEDDPEPAGIEIADLPLVPQLIVTTNGNVVNDLRMEVPRILIGRSDHNDISINSSFISRHHALLVREGSSTFLMDLNSTNGTFVNAKRVSNHVLAHDDVITIGHHKIKFCDPHALTPSELGGAEFLETTVMTTLEDLRNLQSHENTQMLPITVEDTPSVRT